MNVSLMQMTSGIQQFVVECLIQVAERPKLSGGEWDPKIVNVRLTDLYVGTTIRFPNTDIPAGIFNKVIDDMTRVGLLTVDRKTRCIVKIDYRQLVELNGGVS